MAMWIVRDCEPVYRLTVGTHTLFNAFQSVLTSITHNKQSSVSSLYQQTPCRCSWHLSSTPSCNGVGSTKLHFPDPLFCKIVYAWPPLVGPPGASTWGAIVIQSSALVCSEMCHSCRAQGSSHPKVVWIRSTPHVEHRPDSRPHSAS